MEDRMTKSEFLKELSSTIHDFSGLIYQGLLMELDAADGEEVDSLLREYDDWRQRILIYADKTLKDEDTEQILRNVNWMSAGRMRSEEHEAWEGRNIAMNNSEFLEAIENLACDIDTLTIHCEDYFEYPKLTNQNAVKDSLWDVASTFDNLCEELQIKNPMKKSD